MLLSWWRVVIVLSAARARSSPPLPQEGKGATVLWHHIPLQARCNRLRSRCVRDPFASTHSAAVGSGGRNLNCCVAAEASSPAASGRTRYRLVVTPSHSALALH
jgi:hypothetical protein